VNAVPPPNRNTVATTMELADVVRSHRLVMGHYGAPSLFAAGCESIAVQVREPRARLLSLYRFWGAQSDRERVSWGDWGTELISKADLPLDKFLACREVWPATENPLFRLTLGRRSSAGRLIGRRLVLSSAYREFRRTEPIVEWSFRSDAFLERICDRLEISEAVPVLGRENETERPDEQQIIDGPVRTLLAHQTAVDRALLDRLCSDRVLIRRSSADLDREFEAAADRLGFILR
jgi:hypothetical protein